MGCLVLQRQPPAHSRRSGHAQAVLVRNACCLSTQPLRALELAAWAILQHIAMLYSVGVYIRTITDTLLDGSSHQGMLVVESVVPESPADGLLEPGDVLISLNGSIITHFHDMEAMLDDCVGRLVNVVVERGGTQQSTSMLVTDLHAVTPSCLLEVCGGAVHALSYQQARNNRVAVGQVYVAEAGYLLHRAGVPKHSIVTAVGNTPTPTLDAFTEVLLGLQQGEQVPVEYYLFSERTRRKQGILHTDWKWYLAV